MTSGVEFAGWRKAEKSPGAGVRDECRLSSASGVLVVIFWAGKL